jgi:RHS repeat-associated protein
LAYSYDANNHLTKLDSPLGTLTMTYDAAGRTTSVGRPNGTTTTVGFDNANELTQLVTKAGSSTLASFTYGYDAAGNVGTRNQTLGNDTSKTTYTYDPLRRLTADKGGPLPSTYTYDAAGNRLTWSASDDPLTPKPNDPFVQTNAFNAAGELTSSTMVRQNGGTTKTDVTTDSYDNNGNRLKADTIAQSNGQSTSTVYTYDFNNRLLTSVPGNTPQKGNGDGQRNYSRSYDALGRLVTETHGTTATTWTEDGLNPIVAKDSATTLYLRDVSGSLEGEQTSTSDPAWYVTDALGSILGSTNSKAKLANTTTYSDYGLNIGSSNFRMGFGGEIADPLKPGNGIGNDTPVLSQYYARSYDAGNGSWLQKDPIEGSIRRPGTLEPYQFVSGNPSSKRDLMGFLSVGAGTGGSISSVGGVNGSWTSGPLQGGGAFSGYGWRSPAAYGQVGAINRQASGSDLQGAGKIFGGPIRVPLSGPVSLDLQRAFASGGLVRGVPIQLPAGQSGYSTGNVLGGLVFIAFVGGTICLIVEPCGLAVAGGIMAAGGEGILLFLSGAGSAAPEEAIILEGESALVSGETLAVGGRTYTVSYHAANAAIEGNVGRNAIESVLTKGPVGTYEQGAKLAFYDPATRVFLAVNAATGNIVTVIENATENYVKNTLAR